MGLGLDRMVRLRHGWFIARLKPCDKSMKMFELQAGLGMGSINEESMKPHGSSFARMIPHLKIEMQGTRREVRLVP